MPRSPHLKASSPPPKKASGSLALLKQKLASAKRPSQTDRLVKSAREADKGDAGVDLQTLSREERRRLLLGG